MGYKNIIIGTFKHKLDKINEKNSLDELGKLISTLGENIYKTCIFKNKNINASKYFSKGNLETLKEWLTGDQAYALIFNFDLSPAQIKNLSIYFDSEIYTRTDIIVKIFSKHAKTTEAKLQVKMAELNLEFSRLKGKWTHFSRIEGGIGFRGPGEKQINVDRNLLKRDISKLKKRLNLIQKQRETQTKRRRKEKNIAIVGYTNAGKSTLLNNLTNKNTDTKNELFTTLDISSKKFFLNGMNIILSDTVGFIDRLPHYLVASFLSTLEEVKYADLILFLIDISDPDIKKHIETVKKTLSELNISGSRIIYVFNKIDRCEIDEMVIWRKYEPNVFISAKEKQNLNELKNKIINYFIHFQK